MHLEDVYVSSGSARWDSGLLHQVHRSEQDLRKTVVLIPGPSCKLKRWISNTTPDNSSTFDWIPERCSRARFAMGCATDDLVLNLLIEFDKIGAVARDAHDQAPELLRVSLRPQQRLA